MHEIIKWVYSYKVFETALSIIMVGFLFFIMYFFMRKHVEVGKQRRRLKTRLIYVSVFFIGLVVVKIWLVGFAHFVAILSLIAAGIVVANKETIMNFVGGLVISWRGLFIEGDHVKIQDYCGFVRTIGPLYFTLYETIRLDSKQATGKTLRIPNGLVISSPILTFSPLTNLTLYSFSFLIRMSQDVTETLDYCNKVLRKIIHDKYQNHELYNVDCLLERDKTLARLIKLDPKVSASIVAPKYNYLTISAEYYALSGDRTAIEELFLKHYQQHFHQAKASAISSMEKEQLAQVEPTLI